MHPGRCRQRRRLQLRHRLRRPLGQRRAAVRVSLLADALARLLSLDVLSRRMGGNGTAASGSSPRLARLTAATRRLTDEYGLAYLVVKNIMGPLSILVIYAAIRALSAGGAGTGSIARASELVARVALGPGARSFDGVRLPSVGNAAGCVALASTVSSMLFPLVVFGAAKLAPAVASFVAARVGSDADEGDDRDL